ncbi:MAG: 30S ribosomal protein S12 methylthiotransferase RimO [Polyangiales bacterium]
MAKRVPTIHFVSLGCPKNRVDTEVMLGVSDQSGYRLVDDPSAAEVIVVNTCGFIEAAKQESIDTILELSEMKRSGACKRLVVAGCLSQRYPEALARDLGEVDHFLGSSDMLGLGRILRDGNDAPRMLVGNPADYVWKLGDPRRLSQHRHSVYLKISEGCSRKCSFCAIPSFRGKLRSRPIADVVGEARRLTEQGTVELNLISQDTVSYGRDLEGDADLGRLVEALCEIDALKWLRLFYLYPDALSERLLSLFAQGGKLVPYVDMPFQHATDRMLKRMRRGYNAARQRALVERLRERVPGVWMRTAFIVGHPGETEEDFDALCDFVRSSKFEHLGVFRYSHEDGTHSGSMDDLVDARTIEQRAERLMKLQRGISRARLKSCIGSELEVMVEGVSDESELLLQGRHKGQAPEVDGVVLLTDDTAKPGDIRRARVTQAADYDLVAKLLPDETAGARAKRTPRNPSKLRVLA